MLYPSADKLNEFESRYVLVLLAAKRAKQLKDGAQELVRIESDHPLTIALEEIADKKIRPILNAPPEPTEVVAEETVRFDAGLDLPGEAVAAMDVSEVEAESEAAPANLTALLGNQTEPEVVEEPKPTLADLDTMEVAAEVPVVGEDGSSQALTDEDVVGEDPHSAIAADDEEATAPEE